MDLRLHIQNLYFRLFNEHFFTTTAKAPPPLAKVLIQCNYKKRPWLQYPLLKTKDNRDLIFIHIPKCGGTSVAQSLGLNQIRHLPASAFYFTDMEAFAQAITFSVVRNPIDRIASVLMHFRSSIFSSDLEKKIFAGLNINDDNLEDLIVKVVTDSQFSKQLFSKTNAGRSGLSVSQTDFLFHKNTLLVKNLFTLEKVSSLQKWISESLQEDVQIGHHNSSQRNNKFTPSDSLVSYLRPYLSSDLAIYEELSKSGGVALAGSETIKRIENAVAANTDNGR